MVPKVAGSIPVARPKNFKRHRKMSFYFCYSLSMKIDNQNQFVANTEEVSAILRRYGLELSGYTLATSGIENISLFVSANSEEYVLRVYRKHKKSDESIRQELDFVVYLGKHGIPVATPIPNNNGELLTRHGDWQIILMPKIAGHHAPEFDAGLVKELAAVQAKMHILAANYPFNAQSSPALTYLEDTVFLQHVNLATLTKPAYDLMKRVERYSVLLPKSLASGLCHLDYDVDNILVGPDGKISAVLDFDDLANAPYVICLAYTLWRIYIDEDLELVDDYLAHYSKIRPLSEDERSVIPSIVLFRHYVIAALQAVDGELDKATTDKYLRVEKSILNWSV